MARFVLATRNAHKADEIRAMLGSRHEYLTLRDLPGAPDATEDAPTFSGNALRKAEGLSRWLASRKPPLVAPPAWILADDSGLEVDALGGQPGVLSARFAALDSGATGNARDADNNAKLLRLMAGIACPDRTARFRCAVALVPLSGEAGPPAHPQVFEGTCEGHLLEVPRGTAGFGYDPLFVPVGMDSSFAELAETMKNRISHRSRALQALREWLEPSN